MPAKRKCSKFFDFLKQPIKHVKLKLRMVNNGIDISDFGYFLLSLHLDWEYCMPDSPKISAFACNLLIVDRLLRKYE